MGDQFKGLYLVCLGFLFFLGCYGELYDILNFGKVIFLLGIFIYMLIFIYSQKESFMFFQVFFYLDIKLIVIEVRQKLFIEGLKVNY